MLSRPIQHTSSFAGDSAICSIRKTTKSTLPIHIIAQTKFVLPTILACCMSMVLTGCGSENNPTTRFITDPPFVPPPAPSYNLTVESPVLIENVRITLTEAKTGTVIHQTTVVNGNSSVIAVPSRYLRTGSITVVTLSPIDPSSRYFDPMLNNQQGAMASFDKPLHALVSTGTIDSKIKVDPYSEIVYQRALIRSGTVSLTNPSLSQLTVTHLSNATTELTQSFGTVATKPYSILFNSPASIAAINIYFPAIGSAAPAINYASLDAAVALGQLALYARNNPSDTKPYLNFAARAALDMRDGDLDGMTVFGGDTDGTVVITNPILYSGVTSQPNNNPDNNNPTSLIAINSNQRIQTGAALKQAATQYFNNLNAMSPIDEASLNYLVGKPATPSSASIPGYDFSIFNESLASPNVPASRVGAGNYTLAFGLPTVLNFKKTLDVSDGQSRSNDIMQLNGVYKSSTGCQLSVAYDGKIQLGQGSQVYDATVSRKNSDSLTRVTGNQYLVNVASSDLTSPRFIQINTVGASISSASAGTSTQETPMVLDTTDLSCTF